MECMYVKGGKPSHLSFFFFDNIAILSITNIDGELGKHGKLGYISMHVVFAVVLPSLHSPKTSVKSTSFSVLHMVAPGLRCLTFYAVLFIHLKIIFC